MVLRSGDSLLIAFHGVMTNKLADAIRINLERCLPGIEFMLIDQVAAVTVRRPDE